MLEFNFHEGFDRGRLTAVDVGMPLRGEHPPGHSAEAGPEAIKTRAAAHTEG